ncbi:T9SS type A sorting domain-containing protein [Brumimicrobium mesophilum]|uniref:T9SS type A sorting domain-containing protein n=1 Tax=Brumimicrobium mesophilum TaxID=392717 RepID=UPI00131C05E5|nr:T9SS type A sorting domain-containing protein [Brumimicrobium mesophilum]
MKTITLKSFILLISILSGLSTNAQSQCTPVQAPFYESFDSGVMPQCWENISSDPSTSPDNYWKLNDQGDYGAANNGKNEGEFAKADGSNPNPDSLMLITREIDLSQLTTPFISFEWFSNNVDFPGDNTPLIIDVFDGTNWTNLDTLSGDSAVWRFQNYDLAAFMNQTIQVRFMVNQTLTINHPIYNDILIDDVRIDNCVSTTGQDGSAVVCITGSTVNLDDNIIVKPNGGGYWSYPSQPGLVNGPYFNVTTLDTGSTYEVYYIERLVCYDTTVATISFYEYFSAGIDGNTTVCRNEPVSLFSHLSGNIDLGGTWYDFTGAALTSSLIYSQSIFGVYDYTYVIDNVNCPNDSSVVTVEVIDGCGWGWPDASTTKQSFDNISVSPNPASNHLKITNSSNVSALKVEMVDMKGRGVLKEDKILHTSEVATIMIDHLEKGIYTLRVYNDEGQNVYKIVKQ